MTRARPRRRPMAPRTGSRRAEATAAQAEPETRPASQQAEQKPPPAKQTQPPPAKKSASES